MPSRRIATYPNLAPLQEISVNPFSSFNSNVVNKLTRIVSGGKDVIVDGVDVKPLKNDPLLIPRDVIPSYWDENQWEYDTNLVYPTVNDDVLSGFHVTIDNKKPYNSTKLTCKIPKSSSIGYLYGKDITRIIQLEFSILSGNPSSVVVDVGGDRKEVKYPRGSGSTYKCQVLHNFMNDAVSTSLSDTAKDYLEITFYFLLNANDPACSFEPNNTNNEGTTYIIIGKPSARVLFQIPEEDTAIAHGSIDGNYSYQYIHPNRKLKIDPGVIIKDDVMLNPKTYGVDLNQPMMKLDASDETSWIYGKTYDPQYQNEIFVGNQDVYFLNGRDELIKYPGQFVNGSLTVKGNFLDIGKNQSDEEITVYLTDDYEISAGDAELDISVASYNGESFDTSTQFRFSVPQTKIGNYHGSIGLWCYDDGTKKIVFRKTIFNLIDDEDGNKCVEETQIVIDRTEFPINVDETTIQNIKCYLTLGPIKVSGDINEYSADNIAWAYVVCYYSYYKHPEPNVSYYGLIKSEQYEDVKSKEDYVVLAKLRFVDKNTFDIIDYQERAKQVDEKKEIKASDVKYAINLPIADGFSERDYWKDEPGSEEVDVPENVSNALSILAKRRLDDIINEDDKLTYRKNITDNASDYTKVLTSREDPDIDSKSIAIIQPDTANVVSYITDSYANDIEFGVSEPKKYTFDANASGLFKPVGSVDARFADSQPTENGGYWILSNPANSDVHSETEGDCILVEQEWVVIKNDDITSTIYDQFNKYDCGFILAPYKEIIQTETSWKFSIDTNLIYLSYDKEYPLSFFNSVSSNDIFWFDTIQRTDAVLNENSYVMAKVPGIENQPEDVLIGFGSEADQAKLKYITLSDSKFADDKLGDYSGDNFTSSLLSKVSNRIPSETIADRLMVSSDSVGNLRCATGEEMSESAVSRASKVCANGLIQNNNITKYSDTGAITDSGVPASNLSRLNDLVIGPNTKATKVRYDVTNYIDVADNTVTKSFVSESDGVLLAALKWDCNGTDGVKIAIYNAATNTLISDLQVYPDREENNAAFLHANVTLPILAGIKVRFETSANNAFMTNASDAFLEYVFFHS